MISRITDFFNFLVYLGQMWYQINVRGGRLNKYSRILNKEVRIYKEWVYKHYSEMTEDTDNGEFLGPETCIIKVDRECL